MRIISFTIILIVLIGSAFTVCAEEPAITARLLVSNPAPYIGEEIALLLEVTYNRHPGGRTRFSWPKLDDFISADLADTRSQLSRNEQNRLVETVTRRIRPLKSGPLSLHQATVSIGSQNFPIQPLTLRVKPLPVTDRPERFNNQIGSYRLMLTASSVSPGEITLHIYDSNELTPIPEVLSWPKIGKRLIPLERETRPVKGGGREHLLRYDYIPAEVETAALRFSLTTFDPDQQRYRHIKTDPDPIHKPWSRKLLLLLFLLPLGIGLFLFRFNRRPRTIRGCLEQLCQRPIAGLSREKIQKLLYRHLDHTGQEALQRYWQSEDTLRFSAKASTGELHSRMSTEKLRRHLWKGIDKQRDNP
jgi:hypothetical protein